MADSAEQVFEFRKDGRIYEQRHSYYVDAVDRKRKKNKEFLPTPQELRDRANGGYKPFLDGKLYHAKR